MRQKTDPLVAQKVIEALLHIKDKLQMIPTVYQNKVFSQLSRCDSNNDAAGIYMPHLEIFYDEV